MFDWLAANLQTVSAPTFIAMFLLAAVVLLLEVIRRLFNLHLKDIEDIKEIGRNSAETSTAVLQVLAEIKGATNGRRR